MEGWREDISEKLLADIGDCTAADGSAVNTQGKLAKDLLNKKEQDFLIQLICPFKDLDTLIPPEIDIGRISSIKNLHLQGMSQQEAYII